MGLRVDETRVHTTAFVPDGDLNPVDETRVEESLKFRVLESHEKA